MTDTKLCWQCVSVEYLAFDVPSSKPPHTPYKVEKINGVWSCPCKGFQYRNTCRHIDESKQWDCNWQQSLDSGEVIKDGRYYFCPECSREAVARKHTV